MIAPAASLFLALAPLTALSAVPEDPAVDDPLFERVVVVGASVSAGYGLRAELEAEADFATVLASALRSERAQVVAHGDAWFFRQPYARGTELLDAALRERPSLLVAIDYLFWFGYGGSPSEEARLEDLKNGLTLLDRVECPLVLADFPDMTLALEGDSPFGMALIQPHMLPAQETLAELNATLRAWAAERENVTVVPMASFLARLAGEEDVELRGNRWEGAAARSVLQEDLLHPTVEGDAGLAVLVLDTLAREREAFCEACVRWDVGAIREQVLARTHAEREANREKERKRAERQRRREERRKKQEGDEDSRELLPLPPVGSTRNEGR